LLLVQIPMTVAVPIRSASVLPGMNAPSAMLRLVFLVLTRSTSTRCTV